MKNISKFFHIQLIALLIVAMLASCKKDEPSNPMPGEGDFSMNNSVGQIVNRSNEDGLCFEIGYPITVAMPDGSTQTADNEEELNELYNDWFEAHPYDSTCPAIVYPINVTLEDGTTQSVANEEDLIEILEGCIDIDLGWEDCFVIQYPVTILYPDGSTESVGSDQELGNAMYEWAENHPNDSLYPTLAFPITVTKADGTTVEVVDENGLNALFEDCFGTWEPQEPEAPCFEYVFPMTVLFPDGSTTLADSYEALDQIYTAWFENNPTDSIGFPTITYPMNLQLASGEIVTVNNDEEFFAIFDDCYGTGGGEEPGGGFEDCFTFNYPLTLVFPDGSNVAAGNDEELWTSVFDWFENNPDDEVGPTLQYPISITMTEDGSVVTITSDDQLNAILEGCYECVINNGEGLVLGGKQSAAAKLAVKQHAKVQNQLKHKMAKIMAKSAKPTVGF